MMRRVQLIVLEKIASLNHVVFQLLPFVFFFGWHNSVGLRQLLPQQHIFSYFFLRAVSSFSFAIFAYEAHSLLARNECSNIIFYY